jgi:hypothetical protein
MTDTVVQEPVVPDFKVAFEFITPKDVWDNKDEIARVSRVSREEIWETMDNEHREAALTLIRRALGRMHQSVEEWVPEAFEHKAGDVITTRFQLFCTDIDGEVKRSAEATDLELDNALDELDSFMGAITSGLDGKVLKALNTLVEAGVLTTAERDEKIREAAGEQG